MSEGTIGAAFLYTKRKSLSFFCYYILTAILFVLSIKVINSLFVSTNYRYTHEALSKSIDLDLGFSISFAYGLTILIIYGLAYCSFSLLEIQRLRSIGYRHPITICFIMFLLNRVSNYFYTLVGLNWISIAIGVISFIYFIALIFLSEKEKYINHEKIDTN
ncbi:hypothetical protein [Moellerella wisconsensis]|uniref:hypothetical protein n=1 Tax=Moellerella wisconsensis TaxID=158849 RepID=UPI003076160F